MRRRDLILGLVGLGGMATTANALDLDALSARAAAEAGDLSWYESNPLAALDRVVSAFNRGRGARMRVRPESVPGGVGIVGRVANEAQAGGRSADLVSLGGSGIARLQERGLLAPVDWAGLGIPREWVAGPALLTAASIYCVIYNRNQVPAAQAPKGWDDLLDPRWRGRIGTWVRAAAFAELAEAWGEERTAAYYDRFLQQNPMLFRATAPMARQVAAGEIALGLACTTPRCRPSGARDRARRRAASCG